MWGSEGWAKADTKRLRQQLARRWISERKLLPSRVLHCMLIYNFSDGHLWPTTDPFTAV